MAETDNSLVNKIVERLKKERSDRKEETKVFEEVRDQLKKINERIDQFAEYTQLQNAKHALDRKEEEKESRTERNRLNDILASIAGGYSVARAPDLLGIAAMIPFAVSMQALFDKGNEALKTADQIIQGSIATFTGSVHGITKAIEAFPKMIAKQFTKLGSFISSLGKPISSLFRSMNIIVKPIGLIIKGITKTLGVITAMVTSIPIGSIGTLFKTLGRLSGFITAAIIVFDGVMNAIHTTWDKEKSFLENIFSLDFLLAFINGMWKSIVDTIAGIFKIVVANIPAAFTKILEFFNWVLNKFGIEWTFLDNVIVLMQDFSNKWRNFINDRLVPFLETILDPVQVFDIVKEGLSNLGSLILDTANTIRDFISNIGTMLKEKVTELIDRFNPFSREREQPNQRPQSSERQVPEAEREQITTRDRADQFVRSEVVSRVLGVRQLVSAIQGLQMAISQRQAQPVVVSAPSVSQTSVTQQSQTFLSAPMSPSNKFDPALTF